MSKNSSTRPVGAIGFAALAAVLLSSAGCALPDNLGPEAPVASHSADFLACGKANLVQYRVDLSDMTRVQEVWRWDPEDYTGMPDKWQELFRHIDECKPLDGGRRILITASTDGVGIIDRERRAFTFVGTAKNAHSAEFLPGGYIAVAASNGGDEAIVFDPAQARQRLVAVPLAGGHGIEWNAEEEVLVALGEGELKLFGWSGDDPRRLTLLERLPLPDFGGHNLSAIPGTDTYEISSNAHAWIFDLSERRIAPHPLIPDADHVKSLSRAAAPAYPLLWVQAEESWWSYGFRFTRDQKTVRIGVPDQFYKARWIEPSP